MSVPILPSLTNLSKPSILLSHSFTISVVAISGVTSPVVPPESPGALGLALEVLTEGPEVPAYTGWPYFFTKLIFRGSSNDLLKGV